MSIQIVDRKPDASTLNVKVFDPDGRRSEISGLQRQKMFDQAQTHVNSALTDLTFGVSVEEDIFVSTQPEVAPHVGSAKQSEKYHVWNRADEMRDDAKEGSAGSTSQLADQRLSTSDFFAKEYRLGAVIKEEDNANADPALDLAEAAAKKLTIAMLIRQERLWQAAAFATIKWADDDTATTNGGGGDTVEFNDYTNSKPVEYLKGKLRTLARGIGRKKEGFIAVTNRVNMDILEEHPDIRGKYDYVREGILSDSDVAKALGIKRVYVSDAGYASSNPVDDETDSSTTITKILNNHFLLMYPGQGKVGKRDPAGMKVFGWDIPGVNKNTHIRISSWEQFDLDVRGMVLLAQMWIDPKVTYGAAGMFCTNTVASSFS